MDGLTLRFTKQRDGGSVLACTRADGSQTVQHHRGHQAAFFPLHDLTHYAVETELALVDGFYGLIAVGWDIDDTTGKGARGPIPPRAIAVEHLAGAIDLERSGAIQWTAETLNAHMRTMASKEGWPAPRDVTAAELERVRASMRSLLDRWAAIAPGGTLDLSFDYPLARARRS
jgi:hypothetical protein